MKLALANIFLMGQSGVCVCESIHMIIRLGLGMNFRAMGRI